MKISVPNQKEVLVSLFYEEKETNQGKRLMPREFSLEELMAAASAKSKIMFKVENGQAVWDESEVEFTPAEIVILKTLFDSKKTWSVEVAKTINDLKNIFNPK